MAASSEPPSRYGVRGLNPAQKLAWERLSRREVINCRYPSDEEMERIGIRTDFWRLCHMGNGQGLRTIFRGQWPAYRGYTLEFLSTIEAVKKNRGRFRKEVLSFKFRLGNEDRVLTVDEFDAVFDTAVQGGFEIHCENDEFWSMITVGQGAFESGSSKSSAIRNPILRYLHRAISNVVFARSDSGSLNNTELSMLYSLLKRRGMQLNQHIGEYWKRVAKGTIGQICSGGMITALCIYFGVELNENNAVPTEKYLTFEGLFNMDVVKTDQNLHAYCPQLKTGDHFPLPSPALTKVDSWDNQANWQMNTPAHRRVIATFPAALPWQIKRRPQEGPFLDPGDGASSSGVGQMEEDEDDGDDAEGDSDEENEEEEEENQTGVQFGGCQNVQMPQLDFQQHTARRRRSRQEPPIPEDLSEEQRWAMQVQWHRQTNTQLRAMRGQIHLHNTQMAAMNAQMQQQGTSLAEMMQILLHMNPNYRPPPPQ